MEPTDVKIKEPETVSLALLAGRAGAEVDRQADLSAKLKASVEKDKAEREGRPSEVTTTIMLESLSHANELAKITRELALEAEKADSRMVIGMAAEKLGRSINPLAAEFTKEEAISILETAISTPSSDPDIKKVQEWNDTLIIIDAVRRFETIHGKIYGGMRSLATYKGLRPNKTELRKAMDTATSTEGSEWVATEWSADMIQKIDVLANIVALFPSVTIPRGRKSVTIPRVGGHASCYGIPEGISIPAAAIPESNVTTQNLELTPKVFATRVPFSYEFDEDCIVACIDLIRNDLAAALALGIEDAILNGSTSITDLDNTHATNKLWAGNIADPRHHFDGIRKNIVSTSVTCVDCSTFNYANLLSIKGGMGARYGLAWRKGVWIAGGIDYIKLMGLSEVKTIDVYGPTASVVSGEVAKLAGSPIVVSEKVYENVNSTTPGYYDGATTSKTVLPYLFTPGFIVGNKREFTVELTKQPVVQQFEMVATVRKAFAARFATTEKVANCGFNIA